MKSIMKKKSILLITMLLLPILIFSDIVDDIGIEMVFVEGGSFQMGNVWGDGKDDEYPVHDITVSGFYLSKAEVTYTQYLEFMNSLNISPDGSYNGNVLVDMEVGYREIKWNDSAFIFKGSRYVNSEDCPVVYVTWYGAVEYCNWLSEQYGYLPCYIINEKEVTCNFSADGYRLPTEVEWEYAGRGGIREDQMYAGTDNINELGNYAWYLENSRGHTCPVCQKRPNALGLYDMSGNVGEWCNDWYNEYYYRNSPATDPTGPGSGEFKVRRGGSWNDYSSVLRCSFRYATAPEGSWRTIGFRLCRTGE